MGQRYERSFTHAASFAEDEKAFGGVTMDRRSTRLVVFLHSLQVFVVDLPVQRSKKVDVVSFIGPS